VKQLFTGICEKGAEDKKPSEITRSSDKATASVPVREYLARPGLIPNKSEKMAKGESGEAASNVQNKPTRNGKREKGEAGKDKSRRCTGNWTDAGEMERRKSGGYGEKEKQKPVVSLVTDEK
jgi:hypothetical protein